MAPHGAAGSWAPSAISARSASIRPRTLARWATAARWRRAMPAARHALAALRQYGWRSHYISDEVGVNSRLDEVQAAILRVKLAHLDAHERAAPGDRRALMTRRCPERALRRAGARAGPEHVFHLYVVRAPRSRRGAGAAARDGRGDRYALSEPGALAARLSRTGRARAVGLPADRGCGARGAQPADVSGTDRRAGCTGLRRAADAMALPRQWCGPCHASPRVLHSRAAFLRGRYNYKPFCGSLAEIDPSRSRGPGCSTIT